LADLAELLFPGNRNQQHAFLVIWISLKWAAHHMVPNLSEIAAEYGVSKRTLERVRAKMRRMGLIDHVSRFTQRFGYREGWCLSPRFEKALKQLVQMTAQFKDTTVGSQDKDMLILQLAQTRRDAVKRDSDSKE
jgi:predicted DNA-binding transcriptional regulator YafY